MSPGTLHCVSQGRTDQCVLTPELLQAACDANDRRKGDRGKVLSLRGVYNWLEAYEADGAVALAPAVTRRRQDHPEWLNGFLRFYCTPAKVSIGHALEKYAASLPPDAFVPSYDQARRAVKALQGTSRFLDAHRGREGRLALKARLGFITRTLDGLDPTTIYTADGKTFDALVEHPVHHRPFRPEITTVLDVGDAQDRRLERRPGRKHRRRRRGAATRLREPRHSGDLLQRPGSGLSQPADRPRDTGAVCAPRHHHHPFAALQCAGRAA